MQPISFVVYFVFIILPMLIVIHQIKGLRRGIKFPLSIICITILIIIPIMIDSKHDRVYEFIDIDDDGINDYMFRKISEDKHLFWTVEYSDLNGKVVGVERFYPFVPSIYPNVIEPYVDTFSEWTYDYYKIETWSPPRIRQNNFFGDYPLDIENREKGLS